MEYLFSRTVSAPISRPIASEIKQKGERIDAHRKSTMNGKNGCKVVVWLVLPFYLFLKFKQLVEKHKVSYSVVRDNQQKKALNVIL